MTTTTIRISARSHEILRELAQASNVSIQEVLDNALEAYRRQQLLEETNAAYALLRDDPLAWEQVERERQVWDATLTDGLENL